MKTCSYWSPVELLKKYTTKHEDNGNHTYMERHNCLMIFCFLIRGAFLIIFGACIIILGALVTIIGASDLILGSLSKVLGTFHSIPSVQAIILTANPFTLGVFAILFGAWINFCGVVFFIFGG